MLGLCTNILYNISKSILVLLRAARNENFLFASCRTAKLFLSLICAPSFSITNLRDKDSQSV